MRWVVVVLENVCDGIKSTAHSLSACGALITHTRLADYWRNEIMQLLLDGCAAADASAALRWRAAERTAGGGCVDDDN